MSVEAIQQRVSDRVYNARPTPARHVRSHSPGYVLFRYFDLDELGWTVEQAQAFADQLNDATGGTSYALACVTFDNRLAIDATLCEAHGVALTRKEAA